MNANRIIQVIQGGEMFREDGKFVLSANLNRKEVVPLVKTFVETLKNGIIWWNPKKRPLPTNFVQRRVAFTRHFHTDGSAPIPLPWHPISLLKELSEDLVRLVDPPGMGKSSEMTHLEQQLRVNFTSNRIIARVNINQVQRPLKSLSPGESASNVLLKLAPFIPPKSLQIENVRVFLLLDGLDEVCPRHQATMLILLRIFTSSEEPATSQLRVFVTTRPHLRSLLEKEFKLESRSLLPLTEEELHGYLRAALSVSAEQLQDIHSNLADSAKTLLSIPLMLHMFVAILKTGNSLSGKDVNIFELYTKYVEMKHEHQLVEKEGMGADDNFMEMKLEGLLERSLPHYHPAALNLLLFSDFRSPEQTIRECGETNLVGIVAQNEPTGSKRAELLSLGLLVEESEGHLVFKHRSLAEFFYARLLTQETSAPQFLRDTLFGNIYAGRYVLFNVEAFVVGAAASNEFPPNLLFTLSPNWLLVATDLEKRCRILFRFVRNDTMFPLLAKEVLLSFVRGDPRDLREAHQVLLHEESDREGFSKLFCWIIGNVEWTRKELLQLSEANGTIEYPQHTARLITAIALKFEDQQLFTKEEVSVAVNSLNSQVISIVASLQIDRRRLCSKWEWLEDLLSGGTSHLRNLFMQMDGEDFSVVIEDMETAWKLFSLLSKREISTLISKEDSRVGDAIGWRPGKVVVALGEEFLPQMKQLVKFRVKFGKDKGRTLFEIGGCEFALQLLWDDLVEEVRSGGDSSRGGPVRSAVREAFGRSQDFSRELFGFLESGIKRARTSSCRRKQERQEAVGVAVVKVLEWMARGDHGNSTFTPWSLHYLSLLLPYCANVDFTYIAAFLQNNRGGPIHPLDWKAALRSMVTISSFCSHDNDRLRLFSLLRDFLREKLNGIVQTDPIYMVIGLEWRLLIEVFLGATTKQIADATPPSPSLVCDVCVGGVALNLLTTHQNCKTRTANVEKDTWRVFLEDIIEFTVCCDLPTTLLQLRQQIGENEDRLKEVLTRTPVLHGWRRRMYSHWRSEGEEFDACALTHLLSFYFSVFGLNLTWMTLVDGRKLNNGRWILVKELPVEIANVLRGNPQWTHLLPPFQKMLRESLPQDNFVIVGGVTGEFSYKTESEWEALFSLINGEPLLPDVHINRHIYSAVAAPYIRVLIKLKGVEWTTSRLTPTFWNSIQCKFKYDGDSVGTLGSLLHSAIQLGELEEVRRRSWPEIVHWRNSEGKTALEVAKEMRAFEEKNKIIAHLEKLTSSIHK